MHILICPGIHEPTLTEQFVAQLRSHWTENLLIFPTQDYPAYSAVSISQYLQAQVGNDRTAEVIFISFSAGVVGAIGAAWTWQLLGRTVKAFIALDGWGVPLYGNFPIHRISHDYFTHWSSALLGGGQESFYADPPVEHLQLWRSPQTTTGWRINLNERRSAMTAAEFVTSLLQLYGKEV